MKTKSQADLINLEKQASSISCMFGNQTNKWLSILNDSKKLSLKFKTDSQEYLRADILITLCQTVLKGGQ